MGFSEEELEAGDYKYHMLKDEGRLDEMYPYPGLFPNGMRRKETAQVCWECQTPLRFVLVQNIKIDNGDPDKVMHEYCPSCDGEPKIEVPTKVSLGYTWD